jgi:hypothetical protein
VRGKQDVDGRDKPGHDEEGEWHSAETVMRGHRRPKDGVLSHAYSRPKDGVLSHAYDPRIHGAAQIQNSCD